MSTNENNFSSFDQANFPIIGIGTSAGGLEALKTFFDYLDSSLEMAIVIVQHLSPDHKSLMVELLSRNTDLPIQEAKNEMVIKKGNVYLIPAKKNMTIKNGALLLTDKPKGQDLNLPIDIFFNSLAKEQQSKAIAIVLSGTGSDGTRGMRAIKEVGGMLMVQQPEDAKFDGMPNSAIATGLVDYVLRVKDMPDELINFIRHPYLHMDQVEQSISDKALGQLLTLVAQKTGIDFTAYKKPTLVRRITRRMNITKTQSFADYVSLIFEQVNEIEILSKEFLIGVTKFFRDTEAFSILENQIIPEIFASKKGLEPIKIWCVGCSTGEEAYSIGILMREFMERSNHIFDVKIFATDLDKESIQKASKGIFNESIVADVSSSRLQKYFVKQDDLYQIAPMIRKMIIFSKHNAGQDPPFTKMDLVTCRNLLIYLKPELQQKLLAAIHYSINPNSFLFLGPSESLGEHASSFKVLSKKWKIFKNVVATRTLKLTDFNGQRTYSGAITPQSRLHRPSKLELHLNDFLTESLLKQFKAASVYIDNHYDVISADGNFNDYLTFPSKKLRSFNLLKMLPKSLSFGLSTSLRQVENEQKKVSYQGNFLNEHNQFEPINISVYPCDTGSHFQNIYLVIFNKEPLHDELKIVTQDQDFNIGQLENAKINALEQELFDTKASLQATVEEVETTNEELQATNEELLASNEELQSTNEELQSVNEELHTVNSEHQKKIEELYMASADWENLIKSTEIGTIFLDKDLVIRKFTPAVKDFFNIIENDIGRPIDHFKTVFGNENDLTDHLKAVLESGKPVEMEIKTNRGRWYLKRINSFNNSFNKIEGVVISFVDISDLKEAEHQIKNNQFNVDETIGYWDWHLLDQYHYMSPSYKELLGYAPNEVPNSYQWWQQHIHPEDLPLVLKTIEDHLKSKSDLAYHLEFRSQRKDGSPIWLLCYGKIIEWNQEKEPIRMTASLVNITTIKNMELELQKTKVTLESKIKSHTAKIEKVQQFKQ